MKITAGELRYLIREVYDDEDDSVGKLRDAVEDFLAALPREITLQDEPEEIIQDYSSPRCDLVISFPTNFVAKFDSLHDLIHACEASVRQITNDIGFDDDGVRDDVRVDVIAWRNRIRGTRPKHIPISVSFSDASYED